VRERERERERGGETYDILKSQGLLVGGDGRRLNEELVLALDSCRRIFLHGLQEDCFPSDERTRRKEEVSF